MKVRIGKQDVMVIDRGPSRLPGISRFVIVKNDIGTNMVDDNGEITPEGRTLSIKAIDMEAVRNGAVVISASGCVDGGGSIERYSDDAVKIFNAGDKALFINEELGKLMIGLGVAKAL